MLEIINYHASIWYIKYYIYKLKQFSKIIFFTRIQVVYIYSDGRWNGFKVIFRLLHVSIDDSLYIEGMVSFSADIQMFVICGCCDGYLSPVNGTKDIWKPC